MLMISGLSSCGRDAPFASPVWATPKNRDYSTSSDRTYFPPPLVDDLIRDVVPEADVIRGFWFTYSYGGEAGIRVWLQTDARTWVELWASKQRTTFLVEGRARVQDQEGTLVLRLPNDRQPLPRSQVAQFEVFIPDWTNKTKVALFRLHNDGSYSDWRTLAPLNVIK
jgi:hypothetical protein